jgi:hypothetical protein
VREEVPAFGEGSWVMDASFSDPSAVLDHNKVEARPWRVKK